MKATPPTPRTPIPPLPVRKVRLLAKQTGWHFSIISRVMTGARQPSLALSVALAKAYAMTVDELLVRLAVTVRLKQAAAARRPRKPTTTRKKESRTR